MAKKEKVTLQELILQTPELKSSLLKFENVKLQLDKAAETCLQIKVTDSNSLAVCENQMSKVNELVKAVEVVRKKEKEPHFDRCKAIDAAAAYVSELPESAITHLKNEKVAWIKLTTEYTALLEWLTSYYEQLDTVEICDHFATKLEKPILESKWKGYTASVVAEIEKYKKLVGVKRSELDALKNASPDEAEAIKQVAEEAIANIESADVPKVEVEVISKIRRPWTFEVVDINLVPKEFLMVDESKVKEYLKANSDSLEDGKVVNGIKYYKDLKVTV